MERKVLVFFFARLAFSVRQIMILTQSELEVGKNSNGGEPGARWVLGGDDSFNREFLKDVLSHVKLCCGEKLKKNL